MANVNTGKKRIAILTGGGDVPGLNPAIRAITIRALRDGYRVVGIRHGWAGLVEGLVERMRREMEGDVKVVGTGGLVGQMREVVQCLQFVNADLKLEGLRMLWERAHPGASM